MAKGRPINVIKNNLINCNISTEEFNVGVMDGGRSNEKLVNAIKKI